jgi:hypothetical protein
MRLMPRRSLSLLPLAAALLSGLACALFRSEPPVQPATATPAQPATLGAPAIRPADFSVAYHWAEGSLAPPYHYEYDILVAADGAVTVRYTPDYPADDVPVWTETVQMNTAQLDALYADLGAYGLFTRDWRTENGPPVGASSEWLTATANGRTIEVPAYVVPEQAADEAALAATLHDLIPDDTWAKLNAQREQYVLEHSDQ